MLTSEFPVITSNLKVGYGMYGTADPYQSSTSQGVPTPFPNGAYNPPGSLYFSPAPAQGSSGLATASGYGSGLLAKYVLYKSTANPAMVGGSAIVWYTDETCTIVSGKNTEALTGAGATAGAGWLLPNTGTATGTGIGTAISATILNNGGNGSWVWIAIAGFVPAAYVGGSAAVSNTLTFATGTDFTPGQIASGSAITNKIAGWVWTTPASSIADVLVTVGGTSTF